jgi:pyruvate,water dikinase
MKSILWFDQVDRDDIPTVGGKGANLGEMTRAGIPVPPGFIVTSPAYFYFVDHNQLKDKIHQLLKDLDPENPDQLLSIAKKVQHLILKADIPKDLSQAIIKAYLKLSPRLRRALVAVRSSATAEDLPDASFAGQQATFLNIKGESNVVEAVKQCWASLFEARAIYYRQQKGFDHFRVGIAVPVQTMVQSEISGVMFTVDPVTANKRVILIEAIWGLGELIVQGSVTPDRYQVHKQTWAVLDQQIASQSTQLIKRGSTTRKLPVPKSKRGSPKLDHDTLIKLAHIGRQLEQHYLAPQDIEWAIEKDKIFIVQTRPITTLTPQLTTQKTSSAESISTTGLKLLLSGNPASPGIATGPVRILKSAKHLGQLKKGEVLVAKMTTPDYVPVMRKAAAIITDRGGQTSHAAIVSRELGITCVVGTQDATTKLKNGQQVTVNGKTGKIFQGAPVAKSISRLQAPPAPQKISPSDHPPVTATRLYCNLAEPDQAGRVAAMDVDGVGLLRAEFMIAEFGIHPRRLIQEGKTTKFIHHLADGIATIAEKFAPRPVVYRTTDFKTNEYRFLKGGKAFEPVEPNPFIGFRGTYRYLQSPKIFELETAAIKRVRNHFRLKNLWLMLPFVRTPHELKEVKKLIAGSGLVRSPSFKIWMMVEIPSNVVVLEKFAQAGIDGISIGSNDLTMLTLGIDRDNSHLAEEFDTRNPAVLWMLEHAITQARQLHLTSSICGQAPSIYPGLTEKLVSWGITSISVTPDALGRTRQLIADAEAKVVKKGASGQHKK